MMKVMEKGPEAGGATETAGTKGLAINIGRRILKIEKIFVAFSGTPNNEHLEGQLVIPPLADSRATTESVAH